MKKGIYIFLVLIPTLLEGQQNILPTGDPDYDIVDRWDILYPTQNDIPFISGIKNYSRKWIAQRAFEIDSTYHLTHKELYDLSHILIQNNEWNNDILLTELGVEYIDSNEVFYTLKANGTSPNRQFSKSNYLSKKAILNSFYKSPAHLLEINKKAFKLRLNPIIQFKYGKEQDFGTLFMNQRGIEVRGGVDDKIFFYSRILESQSKFPNYFKEYVTDLRTLPGNGLYKNYSSDIFKIENGYDYLNADAYVGFNFTKHVGAQLGYGSQFIGNGLRSLFLSDFANNFFYIKLNTQVWKFHYQNIFGEINSSSPNGIRGDQIVPKKYFAAHYLGLKLAENLDVGIFETVIFNRQQFELQYLNPVILYRSVEHSLGSPDNVMIGIDAKWNILRRFSIYGQILFDEFKLDELTNNTGWWANKYGIQVGIKALNLFNIDQLDAQVELNSIRPFTYSHRDSLSNYSHGLQSLAHPLGANLKEIIIRANYRPFKRASIQALFWTALKGTDQETNWGGNILLPSSSREQDYENFTGQGVQNNYTSLNISASYELFHNAYLDFDVTKRVHNNLSSIFVTSGIRWNIGKRKELF